MDKLEEELNIAEMLDETYIQKLMNFNMKAKDKSVTKIITKLEQERAFKGMSKNVFDKANPTNDHQIN